MYTKHSVCMETSRGWTEIKVNYQTGKSSLVLSLSLCLYLSNFNCFCYKSSHGCCHSRSIFFWSGSFVIGTSSEGAEIAFYKDFNVLRQNVSILKSLLTDFNWMSDEWILNGSMMRRKNPSVNHTALTSEFLLFQGQEQIVGVIPAFDGGCISLRRHCGHVTLRGGPKEPRKTCRAYIPHL